MTRWSTVGMASRSLLRSVAIGGSDLMRFTRLSPTVSEYYAHGYDRLGEAELHYVAVSALACYPVEAWLGEGVEDDRLAQRAPALLDLLNDEMSQLEGLPDSLWIRLASLLGIEAWSKLQSCVLASAHTSIAYLHKKSLRAAMGRPWSLCRGASRRTWPS